MVLDNEGEMDCWLCKNGLEVLDLNEGSEVMELALWLSLYALFNEESV